MKLKRARIVLLPILSLLTAPLIRADLSTSLDIGGLTQFITPPTPVGPLFGNSSASCGAAGTTIASCSQTTSTTIDGVSVSTTVSGTAQASYGALSITSQVSTSPNFGFIGTDSNDYQFWENYLNDQDTASFSEGLVVQAPGYTSGFLQFIVSGLFIDGASDHIGGSGGALAVIDGQSYSFFPEFLQQIDIPVEFGVPFVLSASLELHGQDGSEVIAGGTDSAYLDFGPPVVVDASGNPIPDAIITPEASSWCLLLTAAAFIIPALRSAVRRAA